MPKSSTPPRYSRHSSGQARVRIDGRVVYLGGYGSPESHERYAELLEQWRQRQQDTKEVRLTVRALAVVYLRFARQHYRKRGTQTSEVSAIRTALKHLLRLFGRELAADFSPRMLKTVRQSMIDARYGRLSINKHVGRIKRLYKWAVAEELVPLNSFLALGTLSGLQAGRSEARESAPIRPVPDDRVDAIRPHVSVAVWGAIEFMRASGARPSEALMIRGCDLNMTGKVWEYAVPDETNKAAHHDRQRVVMIGPDGQRVLRQFLRTDTQAYLFSPVADGSRPYRRDSFRNAICRGCEQAFGMPDELRTVSQKLLDMPKEERAAKRKAMAPLFAQARAWRQEHCWHPHQIRHTAATRIRRAMGLEATKAILGHADLRVAEVYAERDQQLARDAAAAVG